MKRVRKFGSNAFKPKMPMAAPRMKKFDGGGTVPSAPKRKLRPEEAPNYNPMDDLYKPHSPSTRGGRRGRRSPPIQQYDEIIITPESYRESLTPKEREKYDKEQRDLQQRRERNKIIQDEIERRNRSREFDRRNHIDPDTYMRMFGRKGRVTTAKSGGTMKSYAKGGMVRGGGCETKGKTKGRFV